VDENKIKVELNEESKLEGDGVILFSKDPEGEIPIKTIGASEIEHYEKSFSVNSKSFYIHYPYNPHRVKCFGYGYNYKLGNNECYNTTTSPVFMPRLNMKIKMLKQANSYTLALTEDGELYRCGYKDQWGSSIYYMEKYTKPLPDEGIKEIRAGYNNYGILTESDKLYIQGYCNSNHLDGTEKSELWHKERPNESEEKILNFDIGYDFTIYTTVCGKCYAAGNEFLKGLNKENNDKEISFVQIDFDEGVIPIKPSHYVCEK